MTRYMEYRHVYTYRDHAVRDTSEGWIVYELGDEARTVLFTAETKWQCFRAIDEVQDAAS